jgi:hypothetical protein
MSFYTTVNVKKGRCTFNKLKIASFKAIANTICVSEAVTGVASILKIIFIKFLMFFFKNNLLYCTRSLKKKGNDKEKSKEKFHN